MKEQHWCPLYTSCQRLLLLLLSLCLSPSCSGRTWAQRKLPCDVISLNHSLAYDCSCRKLLQVPHDISWNATELDLSSNQIKTLSSSSFWNLQNLTLLDLSYNFNPQEHPLKIEDQTFSMLDQLEALLLDGNGLCTVPRGLPSGLQILFLRYNDIRTVTPEDFRDILRIKVIHLSDNCQGSVCSGTLDIANHTFSSLTNLTNLTLSFNRLKVIPNFLPASLQLLKLERNQITHIQQHDLSALTNLSALDLSGNCPVCSNTPFLCFPCNTPNGALQIHPDAFRSLSQLQELSLSGNSLEHLQTSWFENLTNLHYLYLSFNRLIGEIANGDFLSVLPFVEVMDLSYNNAGQNSHNLTLSKNFSKLASLKTLHLENYVFSSLHKNHLEPLYCLANLSVLNLGTNFIYWTDLSLFEKFHNLSSVGLSENSLTFLSKRVDTLSVNGYGWGYEPDIDRYGPFIHKDKFYRRHLPNIKPECLAYGPVLDLSKNNIFHINPDMLQGLNNTACLNLSSNFIGDMFNGSEFVHFSKLKYLDLSQNKVYLRYEHAFSELTALEVLDLSYNKHYFLVAGLNHSLAFLEHLDFLKVLNLSWNEISTLTDKTMSSSSLQELNFQGNRLDIMWNEGLDFNHLFRELNNLTSLDLSYNQLRHIPSEVYHNFPKALRHLTLSKNGLEDFNWTMLTQLPHLEELDLSKNHLEQVALTVSTLNSSLRLLDLSHNRISQLAPGFLSGARRLYVLNLSFNLLELINQTTFETGAENHLQQLSLQGNPVHCTCDLLEFQLWMRSNEVEIPLLASGVTCDMPMERKGRSVLSYDIEECVKDDNAMAFCILTLLLVVHVLLVSLTAHLFYWDLSYILDYCGAKLKHQCLSQHTACVYDAFVMYDTTDPLASDWVLNHLRVELEERGERVRPLCLEERDWMPGVPIMDNLSNSVRQSRKTVFVLTEGFLSRGVVKMAALLVQQRLVEEGVDAMVLLLLQPQVLRRSRILHLRRRLCRRSVLEWPATACPAAQRWFWHNLKKAIRKDQRATHASLHGTYFTGR
ncbi:toll-like receptor 8 [Oncorhynchus masou masou]|uniref:toll-like receptor 8 n=1 Tax=Oncorhynchus masou masou TaxID=90313 RepID=UPI00318373F1